MLNLTTLRQTIETTLATWQWWAIAVLTFILSQYTLGWLNNLYQQTQFPVSFFVGQTTFDAQELKGYWQVLINEDTLGKYVMVQVYDFAYMLTVFVAFASSCIAVFRSFNRENKMRKLAWIFVLIAPQAATFDALENAVSFIMLLQPLDFADWLVYPYSSFAAIKFAVYGLAYLWLIIGSLLALASNITGYLRALKHSTE